MQNADIRRERVDVIFGLVHKRFECVDVRFECTKVRFKSANVRLKFELLLLLI